MFIINRHQEVLCTKLQSVGNLKLSKYFLIVVKMWTKETRFKYIPIMEINVQTFVFFVLFCIAFFCVELYRVALHCSVQPVLCLLYCIVCVATLPFNVPVMANSM